MYVRRKYDKTDKLSALICDNYPMLIVTSRFGMPLGFGDKTINEVCVDNDVNSETLLAVINLLLNHEDINYIPELEGVDAVSLIGYLRRSHKYYLSHRLPQIREKLVRALSEDKISDLIINYFDGYVQQISKHLEYEETKLFPYIEKLVEGEKDNGYSIATYVENHDHIDEPLTEFKDVIIKYYDGYNEEIITVIYDILSCASDVLTHNLVEDRLLVPLVERIENKTKKKNEELSNRERDIVKAIALGRSNKEIADELFISTHTVATHRKNIAAKLKIHNSAGITIYAVVNKLIDISDIE